MSIIRIKCKKKRYVQKYITLLLFLFLRTKTAERKKGIVKHRNVQEVKFTGGMRHGRNEKKDSGGRAGGK